MSDSRIIPINIEDEMKSAYIDYSMSVIVARALPDVRDGLKPVHRRVLFGMNELGLTYNKAHKKAARIVGEVLGKYHPHGDSSVYDTMVRMAQNWSLRYPLVDGQGNFGSMDGDSPAAMRYTEARLTRISDELLSDLEKDTVDFQLNFDDSLEEPTVLPAKFPNLLVNGASGIAVGMATNMLPHNLTEVCEGTIAYIDDPEISIEGLMKYIKAPDFPTGGIIYGISGVREAFETGRGRVVVRGRAEIETDKNGRETIIISEIPYQVNKANLMVKIAELVNDKRIEGISDIRDESDRTAGVRMVVEVKRDALASVVLSQLYNFTPLQTSYGVNNVALVRGRPRTLNLKQLVQEFVKFRLEVIVRRTRFELRKALEKAHILIGLLIALDYIDQVIDLIRSSKTPDEAKEGLMRGDFIDDKAAFWQKFGPLIENQMDEQKPAEGNVLTDIQAKAILEMRLQRLTGLERDKIRMEYEELQKLIGELRALLESEVLQKDMVKNELTEIKARFGDKRRTDIELEEAEINIEDMIADEEVVVTISHLGYIKRTPVTEYRTQGRGGRGSMGAKTRDEDWVEHMFISSNHNYLLLFTEMGKCYWMRVYEIPETSKTASGRAIQNLLSLPKEDRIRAYIQVQNLTDEQFLEEHFILFCTRQGIVKKTAVEAFSRPRQGGILAITINEGDQLLDAKLTNGSNEVFIASRSGNAIRFNEENVRPMGRTAAGVIGITLSGEAEDRVVGMVCIDPSDKEFTILAISEKGSGKRTDFEEYRLTNRGGKGVKTLEVTQKTGALIAILAVKNEDDLMITTMNGITIRMPVNEINVLGRATQGVRVIRLDEDDDIADVAILADPGEGESE
jgi:DNA gyrase subunit A